MRAMSFQIANIYKDGAGDFPIAVPASVATAKHLFRVPIFPEGEPHFGVDLLRLKRGESFPLHTHPGHHLLLVVSGVGTITMDDKEYVVRSGDLYLVEGEVPHAVGAISDHVLAAFGAPHKMPDDEARMTVLE